MLQGVKFSIFRKVFRIGTVRYNWPMSAHASQAFSIAHCTDSEDLPIFLLIFEWTLQQCSAIYCGACDEARLQDRVVYNTI